MDILNQHQCLVCRDLQIVQPGPYPSLKIQRNGLILSYKRCGYCNLLLSVIDGLTNILGTPACEVTVFPLKPDAPLYIQLKDDRAGMIVYKIFSNSQRMVLA
jgi:hypothetical protein